MTTDEKIRTIREMLEAFLYNNHTAHGFCQTCADHYHTTHGFCQTCADHYGAGNDALAAPSALEAEHARLVEERRLDREAMADAHEWLTGYVARRGDSDEAKSIADDLRSRLAAHPAPPAQENAKCGKPGGILHPEARCELPTPHYGLPCRMGEYQWWPVEPPAPPAPMAKPEVPAHVVFHHCPDGDKCRCPRPAAVARAEGEAKPGEWVKLDPTNPLSNEVMINADGDLVLDTDGEYPVIPAAEVAGLRRLLDGGLRERVEEILAECDREEKIGEATHGEEWQAYKDIAAALRAALAVWP